MIDNNEQYKYNNLNKKQHFFDVIILFLFGLYFATKPFYFWDSGLPQISDLILIFSLILFLTHYKFNIKIKKIDKWIILLPIFFVFWVVLINTLWTFFLQTNTDFMISSLFYIYNSIIFLYTLFLIKKYKKKILYVIYKSILISLFLQFVFILIQGGFTGTRLTGSFNNPNQLGYYGLLMVSFLIILNNRLTLPLKSFVLGTIIAISLIFTSLSNAAILSAVGLLVVYLIKDNPHKKKIYSLILFLIAFILLVNYSNDFIENNYLFNSIYERISSIGESSDNSLAGRGYDRIFNYPEYWAFGAGEGAYNRFNNGILDGLELHSTLGNIQISYGIVGLLLFCSFLITVLKKNKFKNTYVVIFILIYGLTHNGIRNTLFWILLGVIAANIEETRFITSD